MTSVENDEKIVFFAFLLRYNEAIKREKPQINDSITIMTNTNNNKPLTTFFYVTLKQKNSAVLNNWVQTDSK